MRGSKPQRWRLWTWTTSKHQVESGPRVPLMLCQLQAEERPMGKRGPSASCKPAHEGYVTRIRLVLAIAKIQFAHWCYLYVYRGNHLLQQELYAARPQAQR